MARLRVGIDVSVLRLTQAGTARYLRSLLEAFPKDEVAVVPYGFGGSSRWLVPVRDLGWYPAVLPLRARRDGVQVLHCPTMRAPLRSPVPLVVTIHDLAVLRHPEAFNRWTRAYSRPALKRVVRAASRVIVVSEFTRRELAAYVDVPDEKVRVIPDAVGAPFVAEGAAAEGDYVLAVGTLEPRKNLPRLVEGFERAGLNGVRLLVAGMRGWGDVSVAGNDVRWLGFVPDDELARLYRGARCVAYVSTYEGFGLPVLEAMACGTPVVAGRNEAAEEVAGGAAVLVDPFDPDAIAAGLAEAVDRREELRALGLERAKAFDWGEVARATVEVYREAAA
ncbi:MAG TPA: glycosyltransferase family 1 protein [Gaiellaceae bacterium]|nr:glycosyltransferase family 1 protein [Gaiellaceae bacterium]